jgi:phospholipid-binding lipoprotein MlaA
LPIFGPSSLRDTGGLAVDMTVKDAADIFHTKDDANRDDIRVSLNLLNAIDTRKNTKFRYFETGSPFEYSLVRYAHIRMRAAQIEE